MLKCKNENIFIGDKMKQWLKSFVHNCVVHPVMPFLPVRVANWLHDKNANWAFSLGRLDELTLEGQKKPVDKQLAQLTPQEAKEWQWYLDLKHYQHKDLIKFKRDFEEWKTAKLFDEFAASIGNGLPIEIDLEPCLKDVSPMMVCSRQLSVILKYLEKGYSVISSTDCRVFGIDTYTKFKEPTEAEFRSAVIVQLKKLIDGR